MLYSQYQNANVETQEHMFWSLFTFRPKFKMETCVSCLIRRTTWPILSCGPTQEPMLLWRGFRKKSGEWTRGWKLARKAVGVACKAIFWLTPSFQVRTFELWFLHRRVFNLCVRSIPLLGFIHWLDCLCVALWTYTYFSHRPHILDTLHVGWLIAWPTVWPIDRLTHWLFDSVVDRSVYSVCFQVAIFCCCLTPRINTAHWHAR